MKYRSASGSRLFSSTAGAVCHPGNVSSSFEDVQLCTKDGLRPCSGEVGSSSEDSAIHFRLCAWFSSREPAEYLRWPRSMRRTTPKAESRQCPSSWCLQQIWTNLRRFFQPTNLEDDSRPRPVFLSIAESWDLCSDRVLGLLGV